MTAIDERRHPARMGPRLDVKALVVFFALAYALSWSWAFPLVAAHLVVLRGAGWPTHYPALFGPAIAAVVVTAWTLGREGVRDLLARMARWRVPLRWWLAAAASGSPAGQARN
jgi:CAAX protease family protein